MDLTVHNISGYMVEYTLCFFISNQGLTSDLRVAYIFKIFEAQSCLMVAQWLDQVTLIFEECSNWQDLKSIFMICDFKVFPVMLLRKLNFGALSFSKLFYVYCEGKTPFFFICSFYICLVKQDGALKVAQQYAIEGQLLTKTN